MRVICFLRLRTELTFCLQFFGWNFWDLPSSRIISTHEAPNLLASSLVRFDHLTLLLDYFSDAFSLL
jgi:hypothetical protein